MLSDRVDRIGNTSIFTGEIDTGALP